MQIKSFFQDYLYPISILSGSIIGVGYLALPYITLQVGIITMLLYFVVITSLIVYLHLIFGQVSLKTPDFKRFPGFIGFHLGKRAKTISLYLIILGELAILLVYLIIGGQFLTSILQPILGGGLFTYIIVFLLALSVVIYLDGKAIAKVAFSALSLLVVLIGLIFLKGFWTVNPSIFLENLHASVWRSNPGWLNLFLPYGAIMFAVWGTGLIPEVEERLRGRKKLLNKVIIFGTIVPVIFYFIFTLLVLAISGTATTDSSLLGLQEFLGGKLIAVALFIGLLTTFTAFMSQGLFLKKVLTYDMGISKFPAWLFTCLTPFVLYLLGFNSFVDIISFIGGILLGIDGIFIILMYRKIGGRSIVIYSFLVIFIIGIIYSIVYFLN